MIDLRHIKSVYFLGIGGIGMSAIARYFNQSGVHVSGYDKTATTLTDQMMAEGIEICFTEESLLLPENPDFVIYTPAIKEHPAFAFFQARGIPMMKRAAVLGQITNSSKILAVAGTHGKTTTSTLITHIIKTAGIPFQAFLGGISKNYGSNFITNSQLLRRPTLHDDNETRFSSSPLYSIVEADEYDKSFLHLHPTVALITSVDADHLDSYGGMEAMKRSFMEFAGQVQTNGALIVKSGLNIHPDKQEHPHQYSYSVDGPADYHAQNIKVSSGSYLFDLVTPTGILPKISVGIPGRFNVENAIGAAAVAHQCSVPEAVIREALATYTGVNRRFEVHVKRDDFVYMDDYAHHPEELNACIKAIKEVYPDKIVTGVFQPHLFSRTRDLAEDFAKSLDLLDEVILLPIYPAREEPISGVSSTLLFDKITNKKKYLCEKEQLIALLKQRNPELLVTLGAGDIDQMVAPIREAFQNKKG